MNYLVKLSCLLVVFSCLVSCSGPSTRQKKLYMLKEAREGNTEMQYRISKMTNDFDISTRIACRSAAIENGYPDAIRDNVQKPDNTFEQKVAYLKYGIEKGHACFAYDLGQLYAMDKEHADTLQSIHYYKMASEMGYPKADIALQLMQGKRPWIMKHVRATYHESYDKLHGTKLARMCGAWFASTKEAVVGSLYFLGKDSSIPYWWQMLIVVGVLIIVFVILVRLFFKVNKKYSLCTPRGFGGIILYAGILGCYCCLFAQSGYNFSHNLGRLWPAPDAGGFFAWIAILPIWAFLLCEIYGVYVCFTQSRSTGGAMKRAIMFVMITVAAFFLGLSLGVLMLLLGLLLVLVYRGRQILAVQAAAPKLPYSQAPLCNYFMKDTGHCNNSGDITVTICPFTRGGVCPFPDGYHV